MGHHAPDNAPSGGGQPRALRGGARQHVGTSQSPGLVAPLAAPDPGVARGGARPLGADPATALPLRKHEALGEPDQPAGDGGLCPLGRAPAGLRRSPDRVGLPARQRRLARPVGWAPLGAPRSCAPGGGLPLCGRTLGVPRSAGPRSRQGLRQGPVRAGRRGHRHRGEPGRFSPPVQSSHLHRAERRRH